MEELGVLLPLGVPGDELMRAAMLGLGTQGGGVGTAARRIIYN